VSTEDAECRVWCVESDRGCWDLGPASPYMFEVRQSSPVASSKSTNHRGQTQSHDQQSQPCCPVVSAFWSLAKVCRQSHGGLGTGADLPVRMCQFKDQMSLEHTTRMSDCSAYQALVRWIRWVEGLLSSEPLAPLLSDT